MEFWTYLGYFVFAFVTPHTLAFNPRHELPANTDFIPEYTDIETLPDSLKISLLDEQGTKPVEEEARYEEQASSDSIKSTNLKPVFHTRWPWMDVRTDVSNAVSVESSESFEQDNQRSLTVEELENQNSNIYNPLLKLDHHQVPGKTYTVTELEDMNANQYNPYLN